MYQALYRKYRPKNFSDVVGEEHITEILKNELRSGKIFHAYLFTGPRGTGKTSCAKILAKAVNCLNSKDGDACCECESCRAIDNGDVLDITEIDAASNNGVENIRDLKEQVSYTPTSAKYRVYIIDEVHMLSIGAFNALLKTLEEPPAHIIFILATTEVHKLPATILSRCQRFDFHRISSESISSRIQYIAEKEGFTIDQSAADMIAALSDGGMRDALSTLDLCAARSHHITDDDVMSVCSLAGNNYCLELAEKIRISDVGGALHKVDELHKNAVDLQRLCTEMISHYRNLMVARTVKDCQSLIVCAPKELEALKAQATEYPLEGIVNAINVLSNSLDRMSMCDRRTEFETAVVKLCSPQLETTPEALLDRLERLERTLKYSVGKVAAATPVNPVEADLTKVQDAPNEASVDEEISLDDGMPPIPSEEIMPEVAEQVNTAAPTLQKAEKPTPEIFDAWPDVEAELSKSAPLLAAVLRGSKAYVQGDFLLIDSENDQFFSLMRSDDPIYRTQIKNAVNAVVGRTYRLGPYKKAVVETSDPLQNIINKLKSLEVPGSED